LAAAEENGKWGSINLKGEFVVALQYNHTEFFSEDGLAPVKNSKWIFSSESGVMVIPMQYEISSIGFSMFSNEANGFSNDLTRVKAKKDGNLNQMDRC
jgi:hypothetical protein